MTGRRPTALGTGLAALLAAGIAFGGSGTARAQPDRPAPAAIERLEQAIAARDFVSAGTLLDDLVEQAWHSDGGVGPEPLLSGLAGRVYLLRGNLDAALPYLRRAVDPEVPAAQRSAAMLALASAEAAAGELEASDAVYARLREERLTAEQRLEVELGIVRNQVLRAPAEALTLARALGTRRDAAARFEAELLSAQALGALGDLAAARAAAERAWQAAPEAPAASLAPRRAALLLAGLGAAEGNRDRLLAMLGPAGATEGAVSQLAAKALPACGIGGLRPADWAIFALYHDLTGIQRLMPVAASRAEALAALAEAFAGLPLLSARYSAGSGTLFAARCSALPSAFAGVGRTPDLLSAWMAERGLFATAEMEREERSASLARRLRKAQERFGPDHPYLIPLQLDLASSTDEPSKLLDRAYAAMRRLGGAEGILPTEAELKSQAAMEDAATMDANGAERMLGLMRDGGRQRIGKAPLDVAYPALIEWLNIYPDAPDDEKRSSVEGLLHRFEAAGLADDPRTRALRLRAGFLQARDDDPVAAEASFRAAGAPADLCDRFDLPPEHLSGGIAADQYPTDANRFGAIGFTSVEHDVTELGAVDDLRIVLSSPPAVFDKVTEDALRGFRFLPAREEGQAKTCVGREQLVVWRLPGTDDSLGEEFSLP